VLVAPDPIGQAQVIGEARTPQLISLRTEDEELGSQCHFQKWT